MKKVNKCNSLIVTRPARVFSASGCMCHAHADCVDVVFFGFGPLIFFVVYYLVDFGFPRQFIHMVSSDDCLEGYSVRHVVLNWGGSCHFNDIS